MAESEKKEIRWHAPEFEYRPKEASWYWLSILAAALIFLFAVWQKNPLFAVFVVVAEFAVLYWSRHVPKTLEFKIDKNGVTIGALKFYSYEDLAGFHIKEGSDNEAAELIFKTQSRLNPYIKIGIIAKDIPEMKKLLQNHLKEIEYEDSLTDAIFKAIGF